MDRCAGVPELVRFLNTNKTIMRPNRVGMALFL
jgi:hypothetical protein